jgi:prepilin-type N-terminal cleavage/methylation domain-containing protein
MRKGFTLVELSIVLIIIGLIIGGVVKGKDLINSADQKKIYNTWIKQWQLTASAYQDRTGGILGDSSGDGRNNYTRLDNSDTVQDRLKFVGLDVPVSNIATSKGGSYRIKGKYGTSTTVAHLQWRDTNDGFKNILHFTAMPTDVALAFDTMTDGVLDSSSGDFRHDGQVASPIPVAWPNASTTATVNVTLAL